MKYFDGEYYHLYNRGAHKEKIFFADENYLYLLSLMTANAKRFRTSIAAYCFMPNHFHLAVRQEEGGSISKCVQTTFNAYTQAVNKQKKLSETLFQGKTQARHIDSDTYILQVIRYIHLKPVTAGFVKRPEDWEFSDYRDWVSGTTFRRFPEFRQREPSEGLHAGSLNFREVYFTSGSDYRQFVEEYRQEKDQQKFEKYVFPE